MALELDSRYPGRFNPGDADYPQGSFKNRTAPGALDGSYLEKDWANDKEGFFQRLMLEAGASANGVVDTALASQYYDALLQIIQSQNADTLNAPIATVAAAATINLNTGAPDTSQVEISGSGATITNVTVAENRSFLWKFTGSNTLVNSASIVTNSGKNITTAAGDSCWVRSTAANTIEILTYKKGSTPQNLTGSGYRIFDNGSDQPLILQWTSGTGATTQVSQIVTFPITFPNACLAAFVTSRSTNFEDAQNAWFIMRSFSAVSAIPHAQATSASWTQPIVPEIFAIGY